MMRSPCTSATVTLVTAIAVSCALAGEGGLSVEIVSPESLSVYPGSLLKVSVVLSNHSASDACLAETLDLPEDWQIVAPEEASFTMKPGTRDLRLHVIRVPRSYPAGAYLVRYTVGSQEDQGLEHHIQVAIDVKLDSRMDIAVAENPRVVIAGDPWRASLMIMNQGNGKARLSLCASASPQARVEVQPRAMILGPAESGGFEVSVLTQSDLNHKARYTVDVEALTADTPDGKPSVMRTLSFDVVPQITGDLDPYHRVPSELRMTTAMESGQRRFQCDFSASGSLDEAGTRRIAFLLRGPDIENFGRYGRRDEYWLSYEDSRQSVVLGDRTYTLSHLTQRFTYGRGAEITLNPGDVRFGCFYLEPRQQASGPRRIGGRIAYEPSPNLSLASNLLIKTDDVTSPAGSPRSQIYSIEAGISPDDWIDLDLEYGTSHTPGYQGSDTTEAMDDHAYRLKSSGTLSEDIRYSFEHIDAGPRYAGYYQGASHTTASLVCPVYRSLRASLHYHSYENDPSALRIETLAERMRSLRAGLFCQVGRDLEISLEYGGYRKQDLLAPVDHDFHERTVGLGVGKTFPKVSIHCSAEYGRVTDDLAAAPPKDLGRCNLSVHMRPTDGQTYRLYTRIGHTRFSEVPDREWSAGLSAQLRLGRSARFHIDFITSRKDAAETCKRNSLFSTLSVSLPRGHTCSLRGHVFEHHGGGDDLEGSVFLVYGVPLGLPAGRRASAGSLKGRIYDADLADLRPLPRVVLSANGAYAVSQADGEFRFPALEPGSHFLQVESQSIGPDRVTVVETPIPFEVEGGKTTVLDIGVVTACRVAGTVTLFEFADGKHMRGSYGAAHTSIEKPAGSTQPDTALGGLKESGGVQLLVEIANGDKTLRQVTDSDGRFDFDQVRPGIWHITFHEDHVPELHHIEHKEVVVDLQPGEEAFVIARVMPDVRPIRIIHTGSIKLIGSSD